MRPFAITVPTIWTGETGQAWKALGREYQLLGHYLISSPYSNMYGLYYQPFGAMLDEVGIDRGDAMRVLQQFADTRYALFDVRTSWVWLVNGWRVQLMSWGRVPPPSDKRIIGMHRWYLSCPTNPFLGLFFDEYGEEFHIPQRRGPDSRVGVPRPQAPHPQRALFERWAKNYPNPEGMAAAWAVWLAIDPPPTPAFVEEVMVPKLIEQRATTRWQIENHRFVPSATRYLTEQRWLDAVTPDVLPTTGGDEVDEWLKTRRGEGGVKRSMG